MAAIEERELSAYHEAGHVLAYHVHYGAGSVDLVTIERRGAEHGRTEPHKLVIPFPIESMEELPALIRSWLLGETDLECVAGPAVRVDGVVSCAGPAAEIEIRRSREGVLVPPDRLPSFEADRAAHERFAKGSVARRELIECFWEEATQLVRGRWDCVEAVAHALLEQETLERHAIDKVVGPVVDTSVRELLESAASQFAGGDGDESPGPS